MLEWSKRDGIVGRAILIDFASYAEEKGISYDPMSSYSITLDVGKTIM